MENRVIQRVIIYLGALVPLFFGAVWSWNFGFTDYRHHQAWLGLPLGLLNIALAIGIFLLNRTILRISIFLVAFPSIASFGTFLFSFYPPFLFVALFGLAYIYSCWNYLEGKI